MIVALKLVLTLFPVCGNPLFELFLNFFGVAAAARNRPGGGADRRRSGYRRGSSGPGPPPQPGAGRGEDAAMRSVEGGVREATGTGMLGAPQRRLWQGGARGGPPMEAWRRGGALRGLCPDRRAAAPRARPAAPGPDGYPQLVNRSAHSRIAGVAGRRRAASAEARRSVATVEFGSAAHRLCRAAGFFQPFRLPPSGPAKRRLRRAARLRSQGRKRGKFGF